MPKTKSNFDQPKYLVETSWLQAALADSSLRVFDCTVIATPNPDEEAAKTAPFVFASGRAKYEEGHIPGAGFIDVVTDLSDKSSDLPMMMPPMDEFAATMGSLGIGDDTRVVLYSTTGQMWAARVWWMLLVAGFDNAALLDGGWQKWAVEGRPVWTAPCQYPETRLSTRPGRPGFADKREVLDSIADDGTCLINALPPEMHAGSGGGVFGRPGRIPGSVNVPVGSLYNSDDGTYLPADDLRGKFAAVGANDATRIITYCGGGIASANDAFVLTLLGYDNVTVYDGSMFEWGNDPALPMETG